MNRINNLIFLEEQKKYKLNPPPKPPSKKTSFKRYLAKEISKACVYDSKKIEGWIDKVGYLKTKYFIVISQIFDLSVDMLIVRYKTGNYISYLKRLGR